MRVIFLEQPKKIFIKEIEDQIYDIENYVKIKVKAVGICGSDIAAYKGESPLVTYPRIIGHEIVGEICDISPNVLEFNLGDKVILEPYVYCNNCDSCKNGRTNCCENLKVLGVHIDGGMKEYIYHPLGLVHKLPIDISWEEAVMIEPLAIALHAVNRLKLKEGEYISILGGGQIGNLVAQIALNSGALPIIIDPIDERLSIAEKVGISFTINPTKIDIIKNLKRITGGRLVKNIVVATGSSSAILNAIEMAAYGGKIVLIGWPYEKISLDISLIIKKELDLYGSRNALHNEFSECIKLISTGKVKVKALISKVITFEDIPKYIESISNNPRSYLKVIGII